MALVREGLHPAAIDPVCHTQVRHVSRAGIGNWHVATSVFPRRDAASGPLATS